MNLDAAPFLQEVMGEDQKFSSAWTRSLNQLYTVVSLTLNGVGVSKDSLNVVSLGFYGTTPIVRPATGGASATRVAGATAAFVTDTYDGYTLAQVVKALRNLGLLT